MSSLQATDRRILEAFLGMSFGYVLDFQTTLSVNLCLRTPGWKYTLSATPTKARQRQRSSVRSGNWNQTTELVKIDPAILAPLDDR
jgi:hypothetical protein